ncbi:vitamin K epoxide reductase family protein [Candidatus Saccharibacteria bacterium]|nr:vitamin K epoxide reductase family protein [Candidatus Saccharibacteria bacterium]MBH1973016.1 vitamin K epoxide reductase family protein [Candidatus Saccharibacteria bacterium]MBH1991219.1 vitamin K epoxide reductase family protein [Candidatus Saccharibacteria bacterium]
MFKQLFKKDQTKSNQWIFGTMLAFGIIGLIASFVLSVEEFHLLKNPDTVLSCTFNLVLNCATVMKTWQASVFGFPNMFIGLMAYPIVITVALAGLASVRFPRWFMVAANIGYLLGAAFAYWLFFNSVYDIEVLCPWCLVVTFSTTILLATITHYNLRENNFTLSKARNAQVQSFLKKDFDKLVVAVWIVLLVALVFAKFGADLFA